MADVTKRTWWRCDAAARITAKMIVILRKLIIIIIS